MDVKLARSGMVRKNASKRTAGAAKRVAGALASTSSAPTRNYSIAGKTPQQVQRRNERERRRVQAVNHGYEILAQQLSDWDELKDKKLTKAQTLKAAILYIRHMQKLLSVPTGAGGSTSTIVPKPKLKDFVDDYDFDDAEFADISDFEAPGSASTLVDGFDAFGPKPTAAAAAARLSVSFDDYGSAHSSLSHGSDANCTASPQYLDFPGQNVSSWQNPQQQPQFPFNCDVNCNVYVTSGYNISLPYNTNNTVARPNETTLASSAYSSPCYHFNATASTRQYHSV